MLHFKPSLAAQPDLSQAQLESLTRSVEQKKQKLEDDICQYIKRKQEELREYEQEVLFADIEYWYRWCLR
jgi:transcription termination factor NusB